MNGTCAKLHFCARFVPGVREIGSLTIKFISRVPHWEPKLARLFAHAAHKVSHFFPETCETSGKYARK